MPRAYQGNIYTARQKLYNFKVAIKETQVSLIALQVRETLRVPQHVFDSHHLE
jgi:hypothetical protein